jgi:putative peptide zinc metalloprotease protein
VKRRLILPVVAVLVATGFAGVPGAARSQDNAAIAINVRDGTSVFRLAFSIKRVAGDVVDSTNAAVAFSSCTDCTSTAIAIEVVLITGDASTVTPTNLALAYNFECQSCISIADAYQFVFSTGGQVHFTAEGNQELARIRQDLEALRKQDLTPDELQARLEDIVTRLITVLRTQLVPAGSSGSSGDAASGGAPPPPNQPAQTTTATDTTPTTTEPAETTTTGETTTTAPTTTTTTTTTTP